MIIIHSEINLRCGKRRTRFTGILVDLVEGLEVHVEDIISLGNLEVGSKIVIQGDTYGVDLDAHISFAQDSEAEGEHKSKFEESFH
jgi:hypothetical protein